MTNDEMLKATSGRDTDAEDYSISLTADQFIRFTEICRNTKLAPSASIKAAVARLDAEYIDMEKSFTLIADALLAEGMMGGCYDNESIKAYVMAMMVIAKGGVYTDTLVDECMEEITKKNAGNEV